jgi:hypothetical protein
MTPRIASAIEFHASGMAGARMSGAKSKKQPLT